jgi:MFS family permease
MINKNITLLKWYNFFYDFRPYGAIAILYYTQVTSSFTLGLAIFSIVSIAATLFEVPTGVLSDRLGRHKTVIYGSIASVIALCFYAFGTTFALLAIGAVFNGLTRALLSGNNDALLYDTLKQQGKSDEFAEKLGKVKSMFEIGLGVSALLAAVLAFVSLQAVVIASIVPQVICAIIALRFIEPKTHTDEVEENVFYHLKEAVRAFKRNAKLRKLSLASVLDYAIGEIMWDFKPAFIATIWPTWALGISRALDNLLGFLGYHYAGAIIKRFGALKTLFTQEIASRVLVFGSVGFPTPASPVLLNIDAFFFGVGETANGDLMHKEFTDKQRATMGSLNSLVGSLVYAILAIAVGLVADKLGPAITILILAVLSISVVVIYANLFRKHID